MNGSPTTSAVDVAAYHEKGFVLIPQLFDADTISRAVAEADSMLQRVVEAGTKVEATWKGRWREQLIGAEMGGMAETDVVAMASAVAIIHNVPYHSAFFMQLIADERLTGAVAALIGSNVHLHHTKYHVKPPAIGAPFPMHQDYPTGTSLAWPGHDAAWD